MGRPLGAGWQAKTPFPRPLASSTGSETSGRDVTGARTDLARNELDIGLSSMFST